MEEGASNMRIIHFKVPAAAYPRYLYTREHVTPLLKRFGKLVEKCNITDPFTIPLYDDVNVYVISEDEEDILSIGDIATRCTSGIKRIDLSCTDATDFQHMCPDLPTVQVASYKRAHANDQIFEYFGQYIVLIVDEDEEVTKETKSPGDRIMCVMTRKNFASEMGKLLERVVFRNLIDRVKVLQLFLGLGESTVVFAALEHETKAILEKRFDKTRSTKSVAVVERDAIHLHDEWCAARLVAIKSKIISRYGKSVPEIRNQLLEPEQGGQGNGRTITALKICEDINPFFDDGNTILGARQIPEPLLAQIKVLQKSQQITREAECLESRFRNHLDRVLEHRGDIEQLFGACMGMYHRSKVPEHERPRHLQAGPTTLKEHVAKDILAVNGVTGCGFRFQTLDIYLKDTLTDDERMFISARVKEIAGENDIMECQIRTEQEKLTEFADYSVGSKLTSRLDRSASVGGFALKGQNQDLCLILARHLADDGKPLFVKDSSGTKSVIAHVLEPTQNAERFATLDIAAASVLKKVRPNCQTKFKDSTDFPLDSAMMQFGNNDIDWLKGLPVHIWGAASPPGLGTIIIPDFYVEGMRRLVKIEDRHPADSENADPFSKAGDSGAFVCADDPDGEFVHVISMLMGSSNFNEKEKDPKIKGEYLSIRLRDGINQLQQEHRDTFRLC